MEVPVTPKLSLAEELAKVEAELRALEERVERGRAADAAWGAAEGRAAGGSAGRRGAEGAGGAGGAGAAATSSPSGEAELQDPGEQQAVACEDAAVLLGCMTSSERLAEALRASALGGGDGSGGTSGGTSRAGPWPSLERAQSQEEEPPALHATAARPWTEAAASGPRPTDAASKGAHPEQVCLAALPSFDSSADCGLDAPAEPSLGERLAAWDLEIGGSSSSTTCTALARPPPSTRPDSSRLPSQDCSAYKPSSLPTADCSIPAENLRSVPDTWPEQEASISNVAPSSANSVLGVAQVFARDTSDSKSLEVDKSREAGTAGYVGGLVSYSDPFSTRSSQSLMETMQAGRNHGDGLVETPPCSGTPTNKSTTVEEDCQSLADQFEGPVRDLGEPSDSALTVQVCLAHRTSSSLAAPSRADAEEEAPLKPHPAPGAVRSVGPSTNNGFVSNGNLVGTVSMDSNPVLPPKLDYRQRRFQEPPPPLPTLVGSIFAGDSCAQTRTAASLPHPVASKAAMSDGWAPKPASLEAAAPHAAAATASTEVDISQTCRDLESASSSLGGHRDQAAGGPAAGPAAGPQPQEDAAGGGTHILSAQAPSTVAVGAEALRVSALGVGAAHDTAASDAQRPLLPKPQTDSQAPSLGLGGRGSSLKNVPPSLPALDCSIFADAVHSHTPTRGPKAQSCHGAASPQVSSCSALGAPVAAATISVDGLGPANTAPVADANEIAAENCRRDPALRALQRKLATGSRGDPPTDCKSVAACGPSVADVLAVLHHGLEAHAAHPPPLMAPGSAAPAPATTVGNDASVDSNKDCHTRVGNVYRKVVGTGTSLPSAACDAAPDPCLSTAKGGHNSTSPKWSEEHVGAQPTALDCPALDSPSDACMQSGTRSTAAPPYDALPAPHTPGLNCAAVDPPAVALPRGWAPLVMDLDDPVVTKAAIAAAAQSCVVDGLTTVNPADAALRALQRRLSIAASDNLLTPHPGGTSNDVLLAADVLALMQQQLEVIPGSTQLATAAPQETKHVGMPGSRITPASNRVRPPLLGCVASPLQRQWQPRPPLPPMDCIVCRVGDEHAVADASKVQLQSSGVHQQVSASCFSCGSMSSISPHQDEEGGTPAMTFVPEADWECPVPTSAVLPLARNGVDDSAAGTRSGEWCRFIPTAAQNAAHTTLGFEVLEASTRRPTQQSEGLPSIEPTCGQDFVEVGELSKDAGGADGNSPGSFLQEMSGSGRLPLASHEHAWTPGARNTLAESQSAFSTTGLIADVRSTECYVDHPNHQAGQEVLAAEIAQSPCATCMSPCDASLANAVGADGTAHQEAPTSEVGSAGAAMSDSRMASIEDKFVVRDAGLDGGGDNYEPVGGHLAQQTAQVEVQFKQLEDHFRMAEGDVSAEGCIPDLEEPGHSGMEAIHNDASGQRTVDRTQHSRCGSSGEGNPSWLEQVQCRGPTDPFAAGAPVATVCGADHGAAKELPPSEGGFAGSAITCGARPSEGKAEGILQIVGDASQSCCCSPSALAPLAGATDMAGIANAVCRHSLFGGDDDDVEPHSDENCAEEPPSSAASQEARAAPLMQLTPEIAELEAELRELEARLKAKPAAFPQTGRLRSPEGAASSSIETAQIALSMCDKAPLPAKEAGDADEVSLQSYFQPLGKLEDGPSHRCVNTLAMPNKQGSSEPACNPPKVSSSIPQTFSAEGLLVERAGTYDILEGKPSASKGGKLGIDDHRTDASRSNRHDANQSLEGPHDTACMVLPWQESQRVRRPSSFFQSSGAGETAAPELAPTFHRCPAFAPFSSQPVVATAFLGQGVTEEDAAEQYIDAVALPVHGSQLASGKGHAAPRTQAAPEMEELEAEVRDLEARLKTKLSCTSQSDARRALETPGSPDFEVAHDHVPVGETEEVTDRGADDAQEALQSYFRSSRQFDGALLHRSMKAHTEFGRSESDARLKTLGLDGPPDAHTVSAKPLNAPAARTEGGLPPSGGPRAPGACDIEWAMQASVISTAPQQVHPRSASFQAALGAPAVRNTSFPIVAHSQDSSAPLVEDLRASHRRPSQGPSIASADMPFNSPDAVGRSRSRGLEGESAAPWQEVRRSPTPPSAWLAEAFGGLAGSSPVQDPQPTSGRTSSDAVEESKALRAARRCASREKKQESRLPRRPPAPIPLPGALPPPPRAPSSWNAIPPLPSVPARRRPDLPRSAPTAPEPRTFQNVKLPALPASARHRTASEPKRCEEAPAHPARKMLSRSSPTSASAPAICGASAEPTLESIDGQKARLANKMEVLSAINSCHGSLNNLSADQLKGLLAKLQGVSGSASEDAGADRLRRRRLRQVDGMCKLLS